MKTRDWRLATRPILTADDIPDAAGRINGQHIYDIKWNPSNIIRERSFADGFILKTPGGEEFASVLGDKRYTRYQDAFAFHHEGIYLGSLYWEQSLKALDCYREKCRAHDKHTILFVVLAGDTAEEKMANLILIDQLMALMPNQVNQNKHSFGEMEEQLDVAIFALIGEEKSGAIMKSENSV